MAGCSIVTMDVNKSRPLLFLQTTFVLCAFILCVDAGNCVFEGFNLTDIESFSPWQVVNYNNGTFELSLCSKLSDLSKSDKTHPCPEGASICSHLSNGTVINYGTYASHEVVSKDTHDGELTLAFHGQPCPADLKYNHSSFFFFKCGKTLGHPNYLGKIGCSAHFEWESYIFCKDLPVPDKEVPCSIVYDGKLFDLSPLTKLTGGYLVDETTSRKVWINVCRDINPGTSQCPNGAASCVVKDGHGIDYGHATEGLMSNNGHLELKYTAKEKPPSCSDKPVTTINFRCPKRGGSKDPVLLSFYYGQECSIEIDWLTEFACPVNVLMSESCQLTNEQHDVDFDLSPLKHNRVSPHPYTVNVTDGADHYIYYINVCDGLGISCGGNKSVSASICQKKDGDDSFSKVAGQSGFMKLRYADGQLSMIHRNGDRCHTNFRRSTIINFFCDKNAINDGKGYPKFVEHRNCSYTFSWNTKYACLESPLNAACDVDANGKRFDLSALVKEHGENWQVLVNENGDGDEKLTYFLNVCHDVLPEGKAKSCPAGSAFCAVGKGPSKPENLGRYSQKLQYDEASKSLKLTYTDGDTTGSQCQRKTVINFFCVPGLSDSAPTLVHVSKDRCYHELEWHTAASCVLSHAKGDNCNVVDNDAGYTFDLSPLRNNTTPYKVSIYKYDYYINVCDSIKGTDNACSSLDKAGICQLETQGEKRAIKIGEASSFLEYYDGVLNLTYPNGEPYNNDAHTPRTSEIAFVCDSAAGKGIPEYLGERSFTYTFEWRTAYACPTVPTECIVTDPSTGKQYDLTRLSKETESWSVMQDIDPADRKKFYMNVCRPLAPGTNSLCSRFAAVCATSVDANGKETMFHGNLGRAESSPEWDASLGGPKLTYTTGNDCQDNGVTKKFNTTLHFLCDSGALNGKIETPLKIGPCEYSIIWYTEAACAVEHTSSTDQGRQANCSVQDPNSDFVFNLLPLAKKNGMFYEVKTADGKKTFKLNICGTTSACGKFGSKETTVCQDDTPVAMVSKDLELSTSGEMTLVYDGHTDEGTGQVRKYVLNFFCDRSTIKPVITLDRTESFTVVFRVSTSLACPPQLVDCVVQDSKGMQYDLSPLALKTGNHHVLDTRPSHGNLNYYINVCRPVNPTATVTCTGDVGACQTGDHSYSMGYVQAKPVVSSDGQAITLLYQGGFLCHAGKEHAALRSTRIMFYCSGVESSPVLDEETDECEYRFVWRTPAACPQTVVIGDGNCKVTESLYHTEFDLQSLHKTTGNYMVSAKGYNFTMNVCGPINSPSLCEGSRVGACQTGTTLSSPVIMGTYTDKLIYRSGQLSLVYEGGKANCHKKYVRKTVIDFLCDFSVKGPGKGPEFVEEQGDCTYQFVWKTNLACQQGQVIDCTYRHGKDVYDLSRLSRPDSNYEMVYNASNRKYILNICRPLVHTKDQTCPLKSGACMIDLSEHDPTKRYHDIGQVHQNAIKVVNNSLTLEYTNGEKCGAGSVSTTIVFECDQNSDALGVPKSHSRFGCKEHFIWRSSAACPLNTSVDDTTKGFGDCTVKNPNTGYEFNLSGLKKAAGYKMTDREGRYVNINVCGGLDSADACSKQTGSCLTNMLGEKHPISAGKANGHLLYRDGVITLEYKDGEACSSGGSHSTIIDFVCNPDAGTGRPVLVNKGTNCEYSIAWHTQLVCETQVSCQATTDKGYTLDFSPLVKKAGKYNVINHITGTAVPGLIYLNLCRPLNPIFNTLCPPGSGSCLIGPSSKPLSLGRVGPNMVFDQTTKEVRLEYKHGDPCPTNAKLNTSSVIILKCGQGDLLEPELDDVTSECKYIFVWFTPLACAEDAQKLTSKCSYFDKKLHSTLDLSSLTESYTVRSPHSGTFKLSPCSGIPEKGDKGSASCAGSSACLGESKGQDGSYGKFDHGVFTKEHDSLDLTFSGGKKCTSETGATAAASTISFTCDRSAGKGQPVIVDNDSCNAKFKWATSLVCAQDKQPCVKKQGNTLFDYNLLSKDDSSWKVKKGDTTFWLNFCQSVHGEATQAGCPKESAVCMKTKDGSVSMLGALNTQSFLMTGGNISFYYSHGNPGPCFEGRRRRSDLTPRVLISLACSTSSENVVSFKDSNVRDSACVYEFEVKTKLACPKVNKPHKVEEKNGKLLDKVSDSVIDLNPLMKLTENIEITNNEDKFLIQVGGKLQLDTKDARSIACKGAALCLYSTSKKTYKNIGSYDNRTYYVKEEDVEVEYSTKEACKSTVQTAYVSSKISLTCDPQKKESVPEFVFKTSDCTYIFKWRTSSACSVGKLSDVAAAVDGESGNNSKKVAIGISALVGVALLCIVVLILHKPERRAAAGAAMKKIIFCRRGKYSPIMYSKLSQSAENDTELDMEDDPFNPFRDDDDEESEVHTSHLPTRVKTYHDDSDEDLLL